MFVGMSRFMLCPRYILYKHIATVKTTIDKQSPHAKLLLKVGVFFISRRTLLVFYCRDVIAHASRHARNKDEN